MNNTIKHLITASIGIFLLIFGAVYKVQSVGYIGFVVVMYGYIQAFGSISNSVHIKSELKNRQDKIQAHSLIFHMWMISV